MPLKIELELSDADLSYFSKVMDSVWKKNSKRPEAELIAGAQGLIKAAKKAKAPEYVTKRLEDISCLIDMLSDSDWPLVGEDRKRIMAAVGYFAVPKDMISDKIPGIGYLDDALVADLVIKELKPDLEGYRDFVGYRETGAVSKGKKASRSDWLEAKRDQLMDRIMRRREQMLARRRENGLTHPILRFKS